MALNDVESRQQLDKHPELAHFPIFVADPSEPKKSYEYLYGICDSIEQPLYAYLLRKLLQMNTKGVEKRLRLALLNATTRDAIMYQNELDDFESLPERIEIYRGTVCGETEPGLSWSLNRRIAEELDRGQLLRANLNKDLVLAYFGDGIEAEVIADIPKSAVQLLRYDENCLTSSELRVQQEIERFQGNLFS